MYCGSSPRTPDPNCGGGGGGGGGGQCPTGGITWPVMPYVASDTGTSVEIEWGVTPYGATSSLVLGTQSEGLIFSPDSYSYASWYLDGEWVSGFAAFFYGLQPGTSYEFTVTASYPYCSSQSNSWQFSTTEVPCGCNSLTPTSATSVQSTNLDLKQTSGGTNTVDYMSETPSSGNLVLLQTTTLATNYPGGTEGFTNSVGFDFNGVEGDGIRFYQTGVTYEIWFNWTSIYSFYSTSVTSCGGYPVSALATVEVGADLYDESTQSAVFSPAPAEIVASGSNGNAEGPFGPSALSQTLQFTVPLGDTNSYTFTAFVLVSTSVYTECGSVGAVAGTGGGTPPTAFTFGTIQYLPT